MYTNWMIFLVLLSLGTKISLSSSVQVNTDSIYNGESSCTPDDLNMTHCSNTENTTSYICPDLDSSLEYISNATQYGNISVAHVCLPSGYFALTIPRHLNVSVTLTGLINQSIIQCDYDSNKNIATSEDELQFTLSFSGVSFVRFDCVQFENCPQPLHITLVEDVVISNSRFERFSEGVFDIFNSDNITIVKSSFIDNYGTGTVLLPFRGNTGAVAVGYNRNDPFPIVNPTILVEHCLFMNNSATVSAESMLTSTNVIASGVFTGRGGGFGVFVQDSIRSVSIWTINSQFIDNYAFSFGGGMYVALNGDKNQHNVTLQGCEFINNRANLGAGGMLIVFLSNGDRRNPMTATYTNCHFARNYAETGGAMYIFPEYSLGGDGNVAFINNCTFEYNEASLFGGAVATAIYTVFRSTDLLPLYHIVNCTFRRNRCADGILNIGYVPFVLKGNNVFMSNFGPAFRIIASVVQIHDEVKFIDNETPDGGALYINSFGQIKMYPNSSMTFERNRGSIGAAIVVSTQTFPSIFNRLLNNPQCFLLYYTPGISFLDINDVRLNFNNNTALEASAIFLTSAQQCSWIGNAPPYFSAVSVLDWPFFKINQSDGMATHIETVAAQIELENYTVSGWPGEILPISIKLVDEINQNASELLQLEPRNQNNKPTTKYRIQPAFFYQQNQRQLSITFAIDESVQSEFGYGNASTAVSIEEPLIGNIKTSFILNATRCLAGYRLASDSELGGLTCWCNTDLDHIRNCEDDQSTILLSDGLWGIEQAHDAYENLVAYPCPPGYCKCFLQHNNLGVDVCSFAYFNGNPDKQCACERKGYLCGDCRDGKGVSALLNHCVDCSNAYGILIGVLVIADGALVIIMLFKNIRFSALLFPTIFFINMISYVGENFPTSYDKVGRYMYYLNSFLSLYFPYDFCLYSGTTALASFSFRYIPFSLSIIVCAVLITWFRYSFKTSRLVSWNSLWLLLTLQYSHVIYTSMTVLNCPRVVNENGEFEYRWFINGTHDCFTGRHTLLGLWAILMLIVCIVLIPFLALVAVGKIKRPHWFGQLARCLTESFKEEVPWWCAIELGRKFILLLFLTPFPQNTCPPLFILMTIFALYIYMMPYKEMLVNVVELLFQLVFILFLLLRSTRDIVGDYLVFPYHDDILDKISFLNQNCTDNDTGVATLTWLLFPFAYFPLLIATILMTFKLFRQIWQSNKFSKTTAIIRNYSQKKRTSTYRVNTVNVRHLTLEFVDGAYQTAPRKNTNENDCEDEDVAATATAAAAAVSTIVKNESFGVEDNLTVTTDNSTKL